MVIFCIVTWILIYIFSEIESLLSELADAREALTESEHAVQKCEHDLFEERRANDVLERKHIEGDRDRKAGRASLATQRVCTAICVFNLIVFG